MSGLARCFTLISLLLLTHAVAIGNATAGDSLPKDSRRPVSVTAAVGDVSIRIDGPKLWTISRIVYQGVILGVEESAYGTVINIKDVGFIGTAHKEVEAENVTDLRFFLDDRPMPYAKTSVHGRSFRVERRSRIRSFDLDSRLELRDNKLFQSVRLRTKSAVEVKVIYPFMYAWTSTATDYLFGADRGSRIAGQFQDGSAKLKQIGQEDMDWLAVYDQPSGKGVVSRILARPKNGNPSMLIVDAPGVYRKYYVMCCADAQLAPGFDETYSIVTGFFDAEEANWKTVANRLADGLKKQKR